MQIADSSGGEPVRSGLMSGRFLRRACLIILALLPGLYLLGLIGKYGVNVPYADEFTLAPLIEKAHNGAVTFHDLFKQHNEHRYVFTRMLFIAFARLAHGDLRAEMFFSAALAALMAINLWIILRRTLPGSVEKALLFSFLLSLLLFSPVQAENWLWGFQFVLLFSNFLFTSGLVVATSPTLSVGKKFAICLGIALVAFFSFGAGVLLWVLSFPVALLMPKELSWKTRIGWGVAWGAAALGAIALYFIDYVKPGYHPTVAASRNPVDYFLYAATFLGAHLSRAVPWLVGSGLLVLWVIALAYAFRYRREPDLTRRMLPWLALGGYAILNAVLAAVARIGFGVNQAMDSRYTSFSIFLSIAVIGLVGIVRHEVRSRSGKYRYEAIGLRTETILVTAFAVFSLTAFSWGHTLMRDTHAARLWGKGALLFSNVMDSGEVHDRYLVANAPEARADANILDRIGLLHPSMIPTAEISKLNTKNGADGFLDYITVSGTSCVAVGWAILPKTHTRPHCVVLSYEDPDRGAIAFRIMDDTQVRLDVAAVLHDPRAEASGWICHFDRSALPPGDLVIRAWGLDANRAILYPLATPKILH